MFIVCPATVANQGILETRSLPKKFFGRVQVIPRRGAIGLWMRLIFEMQMVRYLTALLPFVVVPFMSRDLALPITQAPLAMLIVIAFVEMRVLRLSKNARANLMPTAEAERVIDAFRFRAQAILRQLAARRGISEGELSLVAEQSELARVTPLTFVSIQAATPSPHVLDLADADRRILATLFTDSLSERDLHRANLHLGAVLHDVRIEAQAVSAHTRLAAWIDQNPVEA